MPAHRKTRTKTSRPKSSVPVSIPEPPLISPSVSVALKLYALGGRPATSRDLERVKAKYNIPHSVHLRVPRKGERPEHSHSDGVAFHIDLFDLGLRLPLQPFFRKMFTEMKIAPGQLSLPGWRLLTGLEVLWLDIFGEDISYGDLRGLYQLKKPAGLSVAYFATWGVHGNLVSGGKAFQRGMKLCKFGTSSMKIVCVSFLFSPFLCIYTPLRMNFHLIHYFFFGFLQTSLGPRERAQSMKWGGK